MKLFKFAVHNWKSDLNFPFWFYKEFPSAYEATKWADRITFNPKSQYHVIACYGEENPI